MTPQEPLWGALEALEGGSWGLIGNQGAPLGPPITPRWDTMGVVGVTCGVIGLPWGAILGAPNSLSLSLYTYIDELPINRPGRPLCY